MKAIQIINRHFLNAEALRDLRRNNNPEIAYLEGLLASVCREYLLKSFFNTGNIIDQIKGGVSVEVYKGYRNERKLIGTIGQIYFLEGNLISMVSFNVYKDTVALVAMELNNNQTSYRPLGWLTIDQLDELGPQPEFNRDMLISLKEFKTKAGL